MLNEREKQLNDLFRSMAEALDIPPAKYRQAVNRYETVGQWLEDGEYDGSSDKPKIATQGSFRLGTVVRPLKNGKESDYDIDLVCELPQHKISTAPATVKTLVGIRLKENADYQRMLDREGKRCWTLNYAEQDDIGFHMDILPCISDRELGLQTSSIHNVSWQYAQHAIAITEKNRRLNTYIWKNGGSNPAGYAKWFGDINQPVFARIEEREKQLLFKRESNLYCSIADVPNALVRTPLQRAIQILKRHRDMRFLGDKLENDKPISIVLTTLAALAYQNEGEVYAALMGIVDKLEHYAVLLNPDATFTADMQYRLIERREGQWYIPNPVNPEENFADGWNEAGSHKAEAFFRWVKCVKKDIYAALGATNIREAQIILMPSFGKRIVDASIPSRQTDVQNPSSYPKITVANPSRPWSPDDR